MAIISKLEVTNVFADETTNTVSLDGINPNNLNVESIRSKVMDFNDNSGGDLSTKLKSKNGFNWIGIKRVRIVSTEKTYIF